MSKSIKTSTGTKRPGGWEKSQVRKRALLAAEAAKCTKLTDLFTVKSKPISTVSEPELSEGVPSTSFENEASMLHNFVSVPELSEANPSTSFENEVEISMLHNFENKEAITNTTSVTSQNVSKSKEANQAIDKNVHFTRPKNENISLFLKYHPKQPKLHVKYKLNDNKIYYRKDSLRRCWLSINEETEEIFCSFCLAFSKESDQSTFIKGFNINKTKHLYQRINEHEMSLLHINSTEAYILKVNNKDIFSLVQKEKSALNKKNRQILQRVVETIKVIGKRGLSFRGSEESAFTLLDENLDHGNFLELLLLVSKFDPLLKVHIDEAVSKSKERHKGVGTNKGRGNLVTFLSKTTANTVIDAISELLKKMIGDEIRECQMFSIQIDTTQDINVQDQCSIVIRYVTNVINERLVCLANCSSTTGKSLCDLICEELKKLNIDVSKCIGNATDGASNMQGEYKGFSAWLNTVSPGQRHVWCYAHILNLVMSDITQKTTEVITLFGVLNTCAVFLRESFLRMHKWREISKLNYISVIGETRWWSKDKALSKIFGKFKSTTGITFYSDVIETFYEISGSSKFNNDVRYRAKTILDSLTRFDLILTAQLFLNVFENTSPLSLYLQTKGMDIIQAYRMVESTIANLSEVSRNFDDVHMAAINFATAANEEMEKRNIDVTIQTDFQEKRIRTRKTLAGEGSSNDGILLAKDKYCIQVHNIVMDQVINSLKNRFSKNSDLYKDLACLDPNNFPHILNNLPEEALQTLSIALKRFDETITKEQLQAELKDFATKWKSFNRTLEDEYVQIVQSVFEDDEKEIMEENGESFSHCKTCKNCVVCCYNVLLKFNLHTLAYSNLFLAYKYVLTLSSTQVSCERSFSKLKYILNRLRNHLTQSHLESFMLMSCEKDLLTKIDNEDVIDILAKKSSLMKKLLN